MAADTKAPADGSSAPTSRVSDLLRALDEQADKYRQLEALRRGEPGRTEARRDAMRAIAARFPGALREWEGASLEQLAQRRTDVESLAARLGAHGDEALGELDAPTLAWLRWTVRVQEALRLALATRRGAAASARRGESAAGPARPARGIRTSDEVHHEVARQEGVSVEVLKAALFPVGSCPTVEDDA